MFIDVPSTKLCHSFLPSSHSAILALPLGSIPFHYLYSVLLCDFTLFFQLQLFILFLFALGWRKMKEN
jgi:hypothetical protein